MSVDKYNLFDEKFQLVLKADESDDSETESRKKKSSKLVKRKKLKAVWVDDDDNNIKINSSTKRRVKKLGIVKSKKFKNQLYQNHLVSAFKKIHSNPKWSEIHAESESESDDDLIRTVGNLNQKGASLEKNILEFKKCTNLNIEERFRAPISSVQFHDQSSVALVADSNHISLFDVANNNQRLQSVKFEDYKIGRARFIDNGSKIIAGSDIPYGYYYIIDLTKENASKFPLFRGKTKSALSNFVLSPDGQLISCIGKQGEFFLISVQGKEIVHSLKINENVSSLHFTKDSHNLLVFGSEGKVYIYDLRLVKCIHSFNDIGCIHGTSLTTSLNENYLVTGSKDGVVNIYDYHDAFNSKFPTPFKSLSNFKTCVHSLKFNHTSELMLMTSRSIENGARLIHYPSLSVFSNFPLSNFTHHKITEGDFSPNSGYLALGNNQGSCFLFRLNHYTNY